MHKFEKSARFAAIAALCGTAALSPLPLLKPPTKAEKEVTDSYVHAAEKNRKSL